MLNNLQKCDNHCVHKFILSEYFVKKKKYAFIKRYMMTRVYYQNITQVKRKLLITPRSCTNTAYITTTPQPQFKKNTRKIPGIVKRRIGQCIYEITCIISIYMPNYLLLLFFFIILGLFFLLLNIYHRLRLIKMCNLQHARPSA